MCLFMCGYVSVTAGAWSGKKRAARASDPLNPELSEVLINPPDVHAGNWTGIFCMTVFPSNWWAISPVPMCRLREDWVTGEMLELLCSHPEGALKGRLLGFEEHSLWFAWCQVLPGKHILSKARFIIYFSHRTEVNTISKLELFKFF
jgi:hypothetical protein